MTSGEVDQGRLTPLLHRRRTILTLYCLMVAVALPGLLLLQTDNSPQAFFAEDRVALLRYQRFENLFGRDRGLRVVIQGPGLWTREGLQWLAELERETAKWTGTVAAVGLYGHHRWRDAEWPPDPRAFREKVVSDPLDLSAGWITADGKTATVLVILNKLKPDLQKRLLERLEQFLAKAPKDIRVEIAGLPVVERAIDEEVSRFLWIFFPLLIILAVSLLAATFRNAWDVCRTLAPAIVCQIVVMGAMGYAGVRLNLILTLLAPLLFVISIATAVHIMVLFRRLVKNGLDPMAAVRATYSEKGWPVFWTGVTTFAGFSSLAVADVPPIRSLGVWAGLGISFLLAACFTLFPALLATGGHSSKPVRGGGLEAWARRRGRDWASFAVGRRRIVFAIFAATAVLLAVGTARLRLDTNALNYLRRDNPVRLRMEDLEKAGVGSVNAELVLIGGSSGAFDTPDSLRRLSLLAKTLRESSRTLGAVGPGDVVQGALEWIEERPASPDEALSEAVRQMRETRFARPLLGAVLTRDGRAARVTMWIRMDGFTQLQPLFDEAKTLARHAFPEAEAFVTGQYPLVIGAQRSLLSTMIFSLALTLAAVAVVFRLLTRGFRLTVLALIPNLWPVIFVLGGLGWLAFPLDSTTIMIASVVLGLAVDDTLHALGAFRRTVGETPPAQAAVEALSRTAPGHILTTMVLSAGFGICAFSTFVPVSRFGLLTALAMLGALAADLFLVPALLARLGEADADRLRGL